MNLELEPQQTLLLWLLAVQPEGGMFLSDVGLSFKSAAKRKFLATHGYTEETRRPSPTSGRQATYVILSDKGWEWCQDHMTESIASKSPRVKDVLSGVLTILSRYFQNQAHCSSLGELVLQARPVETTDSDSSDSSNLTTDALKNAIRDACLSLAQGRKNIRVRLADLRQRLSAYSQQDVDSELLAMERAGDLSSFQLDNPDELTPADEAAVLTTPAGTDRHIVYFQGSPS